MKNSAVYQLVKQSIRFLQGNGYICLTVSNLQIFNYQLVRPVDDGCVYRGEVYLRGGD